MVHAMELKTRSHANKNSMARSLESTPKTKLPWIATGTWVTKAVLHLATRPTTRSEKTQHGRTSSAKLLC